MATRLLNATPMDMNGQVYGQNFHLPANKITVIKEMVLRGGQEAHGSEDVARKLLEQFAQVGLLLMDEDNPISMEELKKESLKTFVRWARGQMKEFNDLNLKQASEGLATQLPTDEQVALRDMLSGVERAIGSRSKDSDFVSDDHLQNVQSRSIANMMAQMQVVLNAMASGDLEAAKAALAQATGAGATARPAADPSREFVKPTRPPGVRPGRPPRQAQRAITAKRAPAAPAAKPAEAPPVDIAESSFSD